MAFIALVLMAGGLLLVVFEPRPPMRHFEVAVPSDRFAR
jgi:hypothetical protein